jgi:hypothetical protein
VGLNPANISNAVRKNPRYGGFRWVIEKPRE